MPDADGVPSGCFVHTRFSQQFLLIFLECLIGLVFMQGWLKRGQAATSNEEGSDRWQIIDLECFRSTSD